MQSKAAQLLRFSGVGRAAEARRTFAVGLIALHPALFAGMFKAVVERAAQPVQELLDLRRRDD
jgi:hypothetical protein